MEKFAIGLALGALGGALLVSNNYKMRTLVKKSQEEVCAKANKLMDEKLQEMEENSEASDEQTEQETQDKKSKKKAKA